MNKLHIDHCLEGEHLFVETSASRMSETVLGIHNVVVLVGNPGEGKSAIGKHLLVKYSNAGFIPGIIKNTDDWKWLCGSSDTTVGLIDDAFGITCVTDACVEMWTGIADLIKSSLSNHPLVITCRRHIWHDCKARLEKYGIFHHVVDLNSKEFCLSINEKTNIIKKHLKVSGLKLDSSLVQDISEVNTVHGFPLCCRLFTTVEHFRHQGLEFFQNSLHHLLQEIDRLYECDPGKFCILVLTMLGDGQASLSSLNEFSVSQAEKDWILKIMAACNVSRDKSISHLADAAISLNGVYLKIVNETITFSHDAISMAVSYCFGSKYPDQILDYCSPQFLHQNIRSVGASDNLATCNYSHSQLGPTLSGGSLGDSSGDEGSQIYGPLKNQRNIAQNVRRTRSGSIIEDTQNTNGNCSKFCCDPCILKIRKSLYPKLAQRFIRDIHDGHLSLVLQNPSLNDHVFRQQFLAMMQEAPRQMVLLQTKDDHGHGLMFYAARFGASEILQFVLTQITKEQRLEDDALSSDIVPSFLIAVAYNNIKCISLLLKILKKSKDKATTKNAINQALLLSCEYGNIDVVKLMLDNNADVQYVGLPGRNSLHVSAETGNSLILGMLLKVGADVNRSDKTGMTPLQYAAWQGNDVVSRKLVRHGADVNARDNEGMGAIHFAALMGHANILHLLNDNVADVSLRDNHNRTALHIAASEDKSEFVASLLSLDSDPNSVDNNNQTALHCACIKGHCEIVKLLLHIGANYFMTDKYKHTPLYYAQIGKHDAVVSTLQKKFSQSDLTYTKSEHGDYAYV